MTDISKVFIFRWGMELHTIIDKMLTCASETGTLTKRDRKQLRTFLKGKCIEEY